MADIALPENQSLDELVPRLRSELNHEIKKEVGDNSQSNSSNTLYFLLKAIGIATVLSITGCVAIPRASAQDTKQSYGTEQTVKQEIDLSQYTKLDVEGTEGIEVYVSHLKSNPHDWSNIDDPITVKKWLEYTSFWDLVIRNNLDENIFLYKARVESRSGKSYLKEKIEPKFSESYQKFSKIPGKVGIPSKDFLVIFDEAYTTGDKNKILEFTFYGQKESGIPISFSYQMKVN